LSEFGHPLVRNSFDAIDSASDLTCYSADRASGCWSATACSKRIKRVTGMRSARPASRRWSNGPWAAVPGPWDA